jgi:hypothetical protein
MDNFKVTRHFKVYGNRTTGERRYHCINCNWIGYSFEDAKGHYETEC